MKQPFIVFLTIISCFFTISIINSGCAQIGMPTGGDKDTLAPILVKAVPEEMSRDVDGNRITLNFNEYVEVEDMQGNVLVSPVPKNNPEIKFNLRTITVKLKDTLLPNTTYSINFGNSIRDVNEKNIFKDFTYVFSTGSNIDSLTFSGKVIEAETGKTDSTIMVYLYRNANDTSVRTRRPDYLARVRSDGSFKFHNLPADKFKVYAIKDGDGGKTYNSKTEMFGFRENDEDIFISDTTAPVTIYSYEEEKPKPPGATTPTAAPKLEKKLRYNAQVGKQDLLTPLAITFNNPVTVDEQKIYLTDTNYKKISGVKLSLDSTEKIVSLTTAWVPETNYILLIEKDAAKDSLGNSVANSDTIKFISKRTEDYGKIILRFSGLDLSKNPVLQILQADAISSSYPLTAIEWSNDLFPPGDYGIRILYDNNRNGVWDPGNFSKRIQPEKTILLPQKLSIRANWDNEREIKLD